MVYLCKKDPNEPARNQHVFEMPTLCTTLEEDDDDRVSSSSDYEARLEAARTANDNLFSIGADSDNDEDSLGLNIAPYSVENRQQQQSQEEPQEEQYISDTLSETATGYSTSVGL